VEELREFILLAVLIGQLISDFVEDYRYLKGLGEQLGAAPEKLAEKSVFRNFEATLCKR
jgi:hypothetical protein